MTETAKVYVRYETYSGGTRRQRVSGWYFTSRPQPCNIADVKPGFIGYILCPCCRSNNWTDNGYAINVYECGSCGEFVTAYPMKEEVGA